MADATAAESRWDQYNDLVELRQLYWSLRPAFPDDPGCERWNRFRELIDGLIDLSSRERYWLGWVLTAEAEELEQWRHGEFAAALVNSGPLVAPREGDKAP